jgi:hypothetical protein
MSAPRRSYLTALSALASAGAFAGLSTLVLSRATSRVYGFDIAPDPGTALEVALQVCPLLAALCMMLVAPARDRLAERLAARPGAAPGWRVAAVLAVSLATAAMFTLLTAACVLAVAGGRAAAAEVFPRPRVWLPLLFDLTLIAAFTHFVFLLTRRPVAAFLTFLAYVVLVVVLGPALHVTEYVGFGSTPAVVLTSYDPVPVNYEAAWAWRGYWALVTAALLALVLDFGAPAGGLVAAVRRRGPRPTRLPAGALAAAALVAAGAAAVHLSARDTAAAGPYAGGRAALPAGVQTGGQPRPTLREYALDLRYSPERRRVAVEGSLTVANDRGTVPLRWVLLEKSPVLRLGRVRGDRPFATRTDASGRLVALALATPLAPGERLVVRFSGVVSAADPFDGVARALVFSRAFFLTSPSLLPLPRSPECFAAPARPANQARCDDGENYLLTDRAHGRLSVTVPRGLRVASVGEVRVSENGGTSRYDFTLGDGRLANFFVACGAFRTATAPAADGVPAVAVLGAAADSVQLAGIARAAHQTLAFYQASWPGYAGGPVTVVEAPSTLYESTAYSGGVAINEKLLRTRAAGSPVESGLARFVLAHELAHQWWGYGLVPAHSPGRLFLLESVAHFAAYTDLDRQGILPRATALARERTRYRDALAGAGGHDRPLSQVDGEDWLAYHKGPYVLLLLDREGGGDVMPALGRVLAAYAGRPAAAAPGPAVDSLVALLPAAQRQRARALLTTADGGRGVTAMAP